MAAMMTYGAFLAAFGEPDRGIAMIREAMRLNPFHPEWYWISLGNAFMAARRYEDAIEAYKHRSNPKVWVLTRLAICYALLDRVDEAKEMAHRVLVLDPDFRISEIWRGNWLEPDLELMREGMVKAGLPE